MLDLRKSSSPRRVGKICIWCRKNPALLIENGVETEFCSEICFHMYRRDNFKRRSNCIWCAGGCGPGKGGNNHAATTPTGLIDETRFCSEECLNNYKVKLFCEETCAHLDQMKVILKMNI